MSQDEIEFIYEKRVANEIFNMWLARIQQIEDSTVSTSVEDRTPAYNSLEIGFKLFPIIDSISYNLFGKNGRKYLKKLDYTDTEADLIFRMFRNGQLHNTSSYRLRYLDGEVSWGLMSSSGSGGFYPYDAGYTSLDFPEDNMPAEKAITITEYESKRFHAMLQLDRLTAHVRHDVIIRKERYENESINFIVGQKYNKNIFTIDDTLN